MKSDILDPIASSAPMAAKLGDLRTGGDVVFEHVIEAAQPFLAAIIARQAKSRGLDCVSGCAAAGGVSQ